MGNISGFLHDAQRLSPESISNRYFNELKADTFAGYATNLKNVVATKLLDENSWGLLIFNKRTKASANVVSRFGIIPKLNHLTEPPSNLGSSFLCITLSNGCIEPDRSFLDPDESGLETLFRGFPGSFIAEYDSAFPKRVIFKLQLDFQNPVFGYRSDTRFYQYIDVPFEEGFPVFMSIVSAYCAELQIHAFMARAQDVKEGGNALGLFSQRGTIYFDPAWSPVITVLEEKLRALYRMNMSKVFSLGTSMQALERLERFSTDQNLSHAQINENPKLQELFGVIASHR